MPLLGVDERCIALLFPPTPASHPACPYKYLKHLLLPLYLACCSPLCPRESGVCTCSFHYCGCCVEKCISPHSLSTLKFIMIPSGSSFSPSVEQSLCQKLLREDQVKFRSALNLSYSKYINVCVCVFVKQKKETEMFFFLTLFNLIRSVSPLSEPRQFSLSCVRPTELTKWLTCISISQHRHNTKGMAFYAMFTRM